jgi:hypothetical protein
MIIETFIYSRDKLSKELQVYVKSWVCLSDSSQLQEIKDASDGAN